MLQVTARVFDNNQLVGYQITDGSQTQLFTRQQAWIFAKNNNRKQAWTFFQHIQGKIFIHTDT